MEAKMAKQKEQQKGKGKHITLLSILCVVMAFLLVMTVVRFPMGVQDYNGVLGAIDLDYDLAGGSAYTLTLADDNLEEVEDINSVVSTLEYRLGELGYKTYRVTYQKSTDQDVLDYEIRIELKTTDSVASDVAVAAAYGEVIMYGGTSANPTVEVLEDEQIISNAVYAGSYTDDREGKTYYQVAITFTTSAYNYLKEQVESAESNDQEYYIQINLGDTVLLSGQTAITSDILASNMVTIRTGTESSARQAALQMRTGGLAYKYEVSDGVKISSPYGSNVATMCLFAVIALVLLFIAYYFVAFRGFGIVNSLSLILFILLETLMMIAVPGITLSMGGVVGIMLSTIVTGVTLALIANKIKAEYANSERTVKAAVSKGFKDTLFTIIGIFAVSAVVSLSIFAFTTGVVQCFAITMGIGSGVGIITSLAFSRMFAKLILPIANYGEKFLNLKREEM